MRLNREYIAYSYPKLSKQKTYTIVDIIHERGRCAPYSVIEVEGDSKRYNIVACEGAAVGNTYIIGEDIKTYTTGTITKIKNIPEGTAINSIMFEKCRLGLAAGTFCTIVNHRADINKTVVKFPSREKKMIPFDAVAMIGICAAGGVTEKPLLKAKTAHMLHKARGQAWPKVRGVAMNPVDHPHGGGNHQHIGFPCTISKKAPEGQKVGLVGARTTGRGKKTALKKGSK